MLPYRYEVKTSCGRIQVPSSFIPSLIFQSNEIKKNETDRNESKNSGGKILKQFATEPQGRRPAYFVT
jgi:hypothetical protein